MATKTKPIAEGVYHRLAKVKEKNESFSDVIIKHFPKHSLLEIARILNHQEAEKMREHIVEIRKHSRRRMQDLTERLK